MERDVALALQAVEEGVLDRASLPRLFSLLDTRRRGGLEVSCAEILAHEFRIDPALIRRWEEKLSGPAQRRIGKYLLKRRVGQGGMGVVFEAEHPNLDRPVALKLLAPQLGRDPAAIQGFLREVKSAGRFNHPNIVHAYDAGIEGDLPYLVMEFVDGENLFQVLQRQGPLSVTQAVTWLRDAARALAALEKEGWIHGDGKPSNWIVDRHGSLKLADLGLCRPPGVPREGEVLCGSPPYIAPEQLARDERIDARADIYSLGATFYHLLAGRPPYGVRKAAELRAAIAAGTPQPLRELRTDLPAELAALVDRALAHDPQARFASCRELLDEIERICGRLGVAVESRHDTDGRTASGVARASRAGRGRRLFLYSAILVVAVLIAGVIVRSLAPRAPRPEPGDGSGVSHAGSGDEASRAGHMPAAPGGRAAWETQWEMAPRDYPLLCASVEEARAAGDPRAGEWRERTEAALEEEANPLWRETSGTVLREHLPAHAYGEAFARIETFPPRLRAGQFRVAWDELRGRVLAARQERLLAYILESRAAFAARDVAHARRVLARVAEERPTDAAWYRDRLAEAAGGRTWHSLAEEIQVERARSIGERRTWVRAELAAGRVPVTRFFPPEDVHFEVALHCVNLFPDLVKGGDRSRASLQERGLFARIAPGVLARVLALVGKPDATGLPSLALECEAAQLLEEVDAARARWDLAAAEAGWSKLASEAMAGTAAAVAAAKDLDEKRLALARGAFLRGGAFAAEVSGDPGKPVRFRYAFTSANPFAEWRSQFDEWKETAGGFAPKGSGLFALESIIPFDGGVRAEILLDPPREPWVLFFSFGATTVGFGRRAPGELLVVAGAPDNVAQTLEAGLGFWAPGAVAFGAAPVRLVLAIDYTSITVEAGDATLLFPMLDPLEPAWVRLAIPGKTVIREITLEGEPNATWLDTRRALSAEKE